MWTLTVGRLTRRRRSWEPMAGPGVSVEVETPGSADHGVLLLMSTQAADGVRRRRAKSTLTVPSRSNPIPALIIAPTGTPVTGRPPPGAGVGAGEAPLGAAGAPAPVLALGGAMMTPAVGEGPADGLA